MAGARETQHSGDFNAIINVNWPEAQELFNAARRCLGRSHSELNNLDAPTHEPSNQEISNLLHYLAQKALDVTPRNTQQGIYVQNHQNSADSLTTAWLYASAAPWDPVVGSLGAEKPVPSSTSVSPGLSNSFPPHGDNPRNARNRETQLFPGIAQPQRTLRADSQNSDVLNPSALAQTQFLHYGTNPLTYQPFSIPRRNGRSSVAYSNDTSQLEYPWSHESLTTSITTPLLHGTPNRRSHIAIAGVGPLSTSSKSLEDDRSLSVTHEQVRSSAVGPGTRRERPLTHAEVVSCHAEAPCSNPEQVQEVPESPATTIGSNVQKNKFACDFEGCDKTFEWEWKFKDHWKVHTKEKEFCCPACNAYFGRDRDLVKHKLSQKHKKATHGLSIHSVTSSVHTNPRTLSPAARGKSPGSFSRLSRGRRAGSAVVSRRGPPAAASNTSVAGRSHGEMEVSGGEADCIPSDSTAGGSLARTNTCTSRSRSVKRIRTTSDIDTNNGGGSDTEAPKHPDTESFGASPISPAGRSRNLAPYPPILPSRSNRSSSSLSATQISHRRRSNLHFSTFNPTVNASPVASSNVTITAFSPFHQPPVLPTAERQRADWTPAAADDRTTASSMSDDYMQFINMEYDPQTSHAPQQPILWHTGGDDTPSTISTGEYPRDLQARSYGAGSDGG